MVSLYLGEIANIVNEKKLQTSMTWTISSLPAVLGVQV